jgi:hypothetical protein
MDIFARLEVHDCLQVLCRIEEITTENGTTGPAVITRCDAGFTVETTEGVWSDDEEGWDIAHQFMSGKNLADFAEAAKKMSAMGVV